MSLRRRFRCWRYRRWFARHGDPATAREMASICAALDVPPKLVMSIAPDANHWSAWNLGPTEVPLCPSNAVLDRIGDAGFTQVDGPDGYECHAIWFDESPLLNRQPSDDA